MARHRFSLTMLGIGLCSAGALIAGGAGTSLVARPLAQTIALPSGPYDSLTVDQKKQYLGTSQQQQISAAAQKETPVSNPSIAPLPTERAWPTGIFEGGGPPPIAAPRFVTVNAWAGTVNGMRVLLYAGGSGQDGPSSQGVLLVWLFPTDMGVVKLYPTPTLHGFVHIASWSGSQVTVQTASRSTYVFDIAVAQFI